MTSGPEQFEDPQLKAAIKAQWGAERAPDGLRERMELVLAGEQAEESRLRIWQRPGLLALAASLAVIFGVWGLMSGRSGSAIDQNLLQAVVSTHNICCTHTHHQHPELDQKDFALMGRQAAERLSHPVVTAQLEGWTFDGIFLCNVGTTPSAHLMYTRGTERLSIFSVKHASGKGEGQYTRTTVGDRVVAATVKGGTAHAIVAHPSSASLSVDEVERMLKKHAEGGMQLPVAVIQLR